MDNTPEGAQTDQTIATPTTIQPSAPAPATPPAPSLDWKAAGVPEKFLRDDPMETARELAKAYTSLESKLGQPKPAEPALTGGGVDWDTVFEKGVTDDTLDLLKKAGLNDKHIDSLKQITGAAAKAAEVTVQLRTIEAAKMLGGETNLSKVIEWASNPNNLPEVEAKRIDAMIGSDDWQAGMALLKMKYEQAGNRLDGRPSQGAYVPTTTSGGSAPSTPFGTPDAQIQAISDPRYKTDPEYRAEVQQRVLATKRSGFAPNAR